MDNIKAPLVVEAIKDAGWQRKITAQCDAISPAFPTSNISLAKDLFEGTVTTGKQYLCELEATGLKGSDKDPEKTWNYWWKIVRWDLQDDDGGNIWPSISEPTETPPFVTDSKNVSKPVFDATAGQRYTQYCMNIRTALMQSVEMLTENGVLVAKTEEVFAVSDQVLEYLNSKAFAESPLVAHAIDQGAVPTEVKPKIEVDEDEEISADTPLEYPVPTNISNGKQFKQAAINMGFELDWVMKTFQSIGISKSADFVNEERGSYSDLLRLLVKKAEEEKNEEEI